MILKDRSIFQKVSLTNRLHGLIHEGDSVLVGLSGGPDSAALAAILSALTRSYKLKVYAAHLNHRLSKQADSFQQSAKKTAALFNLPFFCAEADITALSKKNKTSIEEAGRQARYSFFIRLARQLKARSIATAHTQDDQVETVLFRLIRGTSIRGLSGIPYKREEKGFAIIRPLLDCTKAELLQLLRVNHLLYRIDHSNRSDAYRRNRIRHELLPLLEKRLNPRVREAVVRLQKSSLDAAPVLSHVLDRSWTACRPTVSKQKVVLNRHVFDRQQNFLKQELFLRAVDSLGLGRQSIGRTHLESIPNLLNVPGKKGDYFPGFTVTIDGQKITWRRKR